MIMGAAGDAALIAAGLVEIGPGGLDIWKPTALAGQPSVRTEHTAVWTGSRLIVWGGLGTPNLETGEIPYLNTGGQYDPVSDSWTATSTVNAPSARKWHTAVWTGTEMVVWGGRDASGMVDTGARYDPISDSWQPMTLVARPAPRAEHTAIWAGKRMIVWGGGDQFNALVTGGQYDPETDIWTSTATAGAPQARKVHRAVWTGTKMIVWGGFDPGSGVALETGGRYDPSNNSWTPTSIENAPSERPLSSQRAAVWTGSQVIVWDVQGDDDLRPTGGIYDPIADVWSRTTGVAAPTAAPGSSVVWTGSRMIVWGGSDPANGLITLNSGAQYDPVRDAWSATSVAGAPWVSEHTAVWTGAEMVAWGGLNGAIFNPGGARMRPVSLYIKN